MAEIQTQPSLRELAEDILWRLQLHRNSDALWVPHITTPWECDLLTVTASGYAHEFEIKVSRSDFLADFKKKKHQEFKAGNHQHNPHWGKPTEIPSRFWFVTAKGIVTEEDIPGYAGWLEYHGSYLWVKKQAPKIHGHKVSDHFRGKILMSMMHRYWAARRELRKQRKK